MRFYPFWSAAFAFGFCYILQAKALGIIGDKKTGMIVPEASHEVKILHNEKTFGLDILEVDPNTELPCDQVHFFKTEPRIAMVTFQDFKATVLLTANKKQKITLWSTILAEVHCR